MKEVKLPEDAYERVRNEPSEKLKSRESVHGKKISPLQKSIGAATLLALGWASAQIADQQGSMLSTKIEFDDADPANAKMTELYRTSSAVLSLDSSDNKSFSVQGVLAEPAEITVNAIGSDEVLRFAVESGHFALKSHFKQPVQGYSIKITKKNGTPLSIDDRGKGDVLGKREILSLNGSEVRKGESL
jgi:hypothetical protein